MSTNYAAEVVLQEDNSLDLWGIDLSADVLSALTLLIGFVVVRLYLGGRDKRARQAEEANEALMAEAAAAEAARKAAERAQYAAHRELLEIHASVTSRPVFDMLHEPDSPAGEGYLSSLHTATLLRMERFEEFNRANDVQLSSDNDVQVNELIGSALDRIALKYPKNKAAQDDVVAVVSDSRNDRSKWYVGGKGPLSKHHALHVIALGFVQQHKITTAEEFSAKFGAVVQAALGDHPYLAAFRGGDRLLHHPASGKPADVRDRKTLKTLGALSFDGTDYLISWNMGYERVIPGQGLRIHMPLLNHFAQDPSYGVRQAGVK